MFSVVKKDVSREYRWYLEDKIIKIGLMLVLFLLIYSVLYDLF